MPSYDYQCKKCEAITEVTHRITEEPVVVCESCGSKETTRLISATSFHLKGSGWYKTDYASNSSVPSETKKTAETTNSTETKKPTESKKSTEAKKPAATP